MFSPMGKKKILLEQRYVSTKSPSSKNNVEQEPPTDHPLTMSSKSRKIRSTNELTWDSIASTSNLEKALSDMGTTGIVMNKILESTIRYRPEKDAVILKAFQSKHIEYDKFRSYLYSAFWLGFDDSEFQCFLEYFDPNKNGVLNGYDFMIAFTRLGAIRKSRESLAIREKQELFLLQQKENEERKQLEKEKKMELAADFSFSEEVRQQAIRKLNDAAFKFDPNHPACGSTEAFNVNFLRPAVFKEMLKLTFNLKVDRAELGAILKEFDPEIDSSSIPASDFLRYFLRLGIDARDKARMEQRQRQIELNTLAEQEILKKLKYAEEKLNLEVDYNYSESSEEAAKEKLLIAATKYDRYATGAVALDGFECDSLDPGAFKDLIRRVFNLHLNSQELGYIVQKYDTKRVGRVHCKAFLTEFLRLGQEARYKTHVEQLEKQRLLTIQAEEQHKKKIEAVQNSETVKISDEFTDRHLKSALAKLTEAAVNYDKVRGVSLISFEPATLSPLEFKKALKRTFNITLTAQEMGAMVDYFDKDGSKAVHCQTFLATFTILGATKKAEVRKAQLQGQRDDWARQAQEAEKKVLSLSSKVLYNVDFDATEVDKEVAMEKMTIAATKYDASHPAALGLEGFERKSMAAGEFKELVRRTFNLKLTGSEVGALFEFFNAGSGQEIDCKEFLRHFLHLGITERNKVKQEQLQRQRLEDYQREQEQQRKLEEAANRQTFMVDSDYTEADQESILLKLSNASEGFDKTHPAAPSLEAFEVAYLSPGIFRENLKRVFNILATPKEIGYLMSVYDKEKQGKIDSKEFMIKFLALGKKIRDDKRRAFLEEQRLAVKTAKIEEERKLSALWDKAELSIDYNITGSDLRSAIEKMTDASYKYDKTHPSAPSLDGFSGGPIKAGVFKELIKRAFNINFTPKELGAVVKRYSYAKNPHMVDGKIFLIAFMKLGFDARSRIKAYTLQKQRQEEIQRKTNDERKLLLITQKNELNLEDTEFTEADRKSALEKLTKISALYDKNAPGCVSLDAFTTSYLTANVFREVIKKTFNLILTNKELTAIINEYQHTDYKNTIDCNKFLISFIRMGSEERNQNKIIQLNKQRNDDILRKSEHVRILKKQETKLLIKLTYIYTEHDKDEAFKKLLKYSKKYDKNHPNAMSLDGFNEKFLLPHIFREMIKRTFGVIFNEGELNACIHFFDPKKTGKINSRKFLIYFLKLGIAEREKDYKNSLEKLRNDIYMKEKEHEEKLALQWSKNEISLNFQFTETERKSALEKLSDAAFRFDPSSPGPMGLVAFNGKKLSPAIFKEMLRRTFNMKITTAELAALIVEFDNNNSKHIDCSEFMVCFTKLGFERRSQLRTEQLQRQKRMNIELEQETIEKQRQADMKMEAKLEMDFSSEDFNDALEKIRVIASNYDRSHASAPSLKGFTGTNMKPNEFKDMLMRTFKVTLTEKQLGALVSIFGVERFEDEETVRSKHQDEGVRIDNNEFLKYFNKIQRDEQAKRHRERIQRERDLAAQEKEAERQLENKKKHDELKRLVYGEEDEVSLLDKIRHAAQEYAVDSALYMEGMQGFKGPALPPNKFRELFAKIFNIKFTYPEIGVLLSILDLGGIGTLDGTRFLNWFYKICRLEERFMLGETTEAVSFETLKAASTISTAGPTRANTAKSSRGGTAGNLGNSSSIARSWAADTSVDYMLSEGGSLDSSSLQTGGRAAGGISHNIHATGRKPGSSYAPHHISSKYSLTFGDDESITSQVQTNNAHSFTESTINRNWILPTITAVATKPSIASSSFGSMASMEEEDPWQAAEDARKHLADVFSFDGDTTRQQTRELFTSSAFLDDIDRALAEESTIYAFDGELITGYGAPRDASPPRSNNHTAARTKKVLSKHSSMSNMSIPSSQTASGDVSATRSHLRTAPGKQQRPRRVANEVTSTIPAPAHMLLVPYDLPVSQTRTATPSKSHKVDEHNASSGRLSRATSPDALTDRTGSPFSALLDPSTGSSKAPVKSPKSPTLFGTHSGTTTSSSAAATTTTLHQPQPLNPLKLTSAASTQKRIEDEKFMQAIFAPPERSPYAQAIKIPDRYPTSTSNLQKDPLLRLKLANAHFHDTPIAKMKKKRPDLFGERAMDTSTPSAATAAACMLIPNTLPVSRSTLTSSPPRRATKATTGGGSKEDTVSKARTAPKPTDGAGFFFPVLLSSAAAGTAETESVVPSAEHQSEDSLAFTAGKSPSPTASTTASTTGKKNKESRLQLAHVPNIGVVGLEQSAEQLTEQLDDFEFLKNILQ